MKHTHQFDDTKETRHSDNNGGILAITYCSSCTARRIRWMPGLRERLSRLQTPKTTIEEPTE